MKNSIFLKELQSIIKSRQLVEINLKGAPTYKVAYILAINDEYITFAEVSSSASFAGVIICFTEDIESISIDTIYLSELSKQIINDSLYTLAENTIKEVREFTFEGFVSAFKNTSTVLEITTENEVTIAGRVITINNDILLLDEYSSESDRRIARSYFKREVIVRLAIDVPWLRTISRSLVDKNI